MVVAACAGVAVLVVAVALGVHWAQRDGESTGPSFSHDGSSPAPSPEPARPDQEALRRLAEIEAQRPQTLDGYDQLLERLRQWKDEVAALQDISDRRRRDLNREAERLKRQLEQERGDLDELIGKQFQLARDEVEHLIRIERFDEALARIEEALQQETDRQRRGIFEVQRELIGRIRAPLERLGEIAQRVGQGSATEADVANLRDHLQHEAVEVHQRAQGIFAAYHRPRLVEEQGTRLERRREEARRRAEAIRSGDTSVRISGSPDATVLFVAPTRETCLDTLLDLLPEELEPLVDDFRNAVLYLRSSERWYELQERGRALLRGGRLLALAESFRGVAVVHYWLAVAALAGEDFPLAQRAAGEAIHAAPEFAEPYALLGRVQLELNDFDGAERNLRTALQRAPDLSYAHLYLSLLRWYRLEGAEAVREELRAAEELDATLALAVQQVKRVLGGPDWSRGPFRSESEHYIVLTDDSQERADQIRDRLEAMREVYADLVGGELEPGRKGRKVPVFHFREPADFYKYQQQSTGEATPGVLGYYSPTFRQFVFFNLGRQAGGQEAWPEEDFWHVVYHEGFHHYAHMAMPHIPRWFNEALAEYAGGTRIGADNRTIEERGVVNRFLREVRIRQTLKSNIAHNQYDVLPNILRNPATPADLGYVQGWSMVHFFLHAEGGVYRRYLERYVRELRKGETPEEAYRAAFGRLDMTGVWLRHVREQLLPLVPDEPPQGQNAGS